MQKLDEIVEPFAWGVRCLGEHCLDFNALDPDIALGLKGEGGALGFEALRITRENPVRRTGAGQDEADGEHPAIRLVNRCLQGPSDQRAGLVQGRCGRHIDGDAGPAHHVDRDRLDLADAPTLDGHEGKALGSGLIDMPALQVSREDHVWCLAQHLAGVHMAEGPVVIPLGNQIAQLAGSVGVMPRAACRGRVEDADVEKAGNRLRVTRRQILRDCAVGKALPVDGDAEVGEPPSIRCPAGELMDIARASSISG